ncbi:manganese and iron superoxide dismutase [Atractiella rhizophila]|nr:manganese and iron superoxide dismutase [Atractiella rhizophila]
MIIRRLLHTRVPLPYSTAGGLPPFLSSHALKQIGEVWQEDMMRKLNDQVQGTENSTKSLLQTVLSTSLSPSSSLTYSYSSLLLSNHLFLSSLSPTPTTLSPSSALLAGLEKTYGSFKNFEDVWQQTALNTYVAGHLWLVYYAPQEKLEIKWTAGSGTVVVPGGKREMNFQTSPSNGNRQLFPLLCLGLWERNWVWDYGVGLEAKEEYVKRHLGAVDWKKVEDKFEGIRRGVVRPEASGEKK